MGRQPLGGAIAAGHPLTAEAGLEMLRQGGNAFDAAAAAVLTSWVVESPLTSPAGGGFLLAYTAERQAQLFDFFTQTPRQRRSPPLDFYPVGVNFGGAVQEFHIGLASMAVPGALKGIHAVHQRLGRLPFGAVAEPAIHYAERGVVLNDFQAYCLQILAPILTASTEGRAIYAPQGSLAQAGDVLHFRDLAETLRGWVRHGIEGLYQGEMAQQLAADCRQRGGHLSLEDLAHYRVQGRSPLQIRYRGHTLLTNPPPSSGGALIAFALALLETQDLGAMGFGSDRHLATLATAMALTNAARKDGYDDHIHSADIAQRFLGLDHVQPYQAELTNAVNRWGSTTHISVLDAEGNAASVTTSNGEGSGYLIPGTGIMVNNMLGEEDLNPAGFHRWAENVRMSSMMAPTLVLREGRPEVVLGSGGSNRIRTAILQVISNILDFGMAAPAAVSSPRIHWEQGRLSLEPGFDPGAVERLARYRPAIAQEQTQWQAPSMFFGGVHTVMARAGDRFAGAGDERRSGVFLADSFS